jgi:hypothetical protein
MATDKADDLTAERAAIALLEQMGLYGHPAASQFVGDILAALKTARQEALREAAKVCRDRAVLLEPSSKRWELNMVSKAKSDEANDLADKLDRLASEGA